MAGGHVYQRLTMGSVATIVNEVYNICRQEIFWWWLCGVEVLHGSYDCRLPKCSVWCGWTLTRKVDGG